ncbi:MAG TPA: hypothetical protein VGB52_02015 [Actinomycetota bacterium]
MAITRRARGSRSRAILAAGLLAVAAIAAMPARSATPVAPVLVSTSIGATNGWSDGRVVMARFDQRLGEETGGVVTITPGTTATVTESDGTAVAGDITLAAAEFSSKLDVIVWTPDLTGLVDEDNGFALRTMREGDYIVTFTAESETSGLETSVPPIAFRVDPAIPNTPNVLTPGDLDPVTGDLEITGVVSDAKGKNNGAYKSGVNRVLLYFYELTDVLSYRPFPPDPAAISTDHLNWLPQNSEVRSLRRGATLQACTTSINGCSSFDDLGNPVVTQDVAFSATISDLSPGVWGIKVRALDQAGNVSNEASVSIIKL